MCGIGAIFNGNPKEITGIMQPILSRGEPDSFNERRIIGKNALACNRLRIVGRDTGKQPISNETEEIFAVFNGEVYNHEALRDELRSLGHDFSTETDTEVLVHGYEEWGKELPKKLDGMFAFIILDKKNGNFLAARDPYGIKPLFFAFEGKTTYLASEAKQLVGCCSLVKELMPGTRMHNRTIEPYYTLPQDEVTDSPEEMALHIRELVDQAVKKRCNTDLPIAVFLSGGIDSTAVLATARKYHPKVAAIVVGHEWDSENSDFHAAVRYCKENDIPLISAEPPSEEELFKTIPEVVRITESFEPNMIKQSTLSLFLAKIAAKYNFKIVLCGEGADEVFCGYPEFTQVDLSQVNSLSLKFFKNLYRTQLQRVDRTSMAYTIEVRVPLMDVKLVEYGLNIPVKYKVHGSVTKWIFRRAMEDRLPQYIYDRKKVVLSEGMGHKDNSLQNGLFTDKIEKLVTKNYLGLAKKRHPSFKIEWKEEAYYLQLYELYGYLKKEFTGRAVVNKTPSVCTSDTIIQIFSRGKYSRDKPSHITKMRKLISDSLSRQVPIPLVGFWGVGSKRTPDVMDRETLNHLQELNQEVKKVYPPGLDMLFILADKHGDMNGVSAHAQNTYLKKIDSLLKKSRFKTVLVSTLWNEFSITDRLILEKLRLKQNGWWKKVPHHIFMEHNAARYNSRNNPQTAAKIYYIMRCLERPILQKIFHGYIFHTFSSRHMAEILPKIPTLHLYSRKGWSDVPWFHTKNKIKNS